MKPESSRWYNISCGLSCSYVCCVYIPIFQRLFNMISKYQWRSGLGISRKKWRFLPVRIYVCSLRADLHNRRMYISFEYRVLIFRKAVGNTKINQNQADLQLGINVYRICMCYTCVLAVKTPCWTQVRLSIPSIVYIAVTKISNEIFSI